MTSQDEGAVSVSKLRLRENLHRYIAPAVLCTEKKGRIDADKGAHNEKAYKRQYNKHHKALHALIHRHFVQRMYKENVL
jgi:hypothetical protein